MTKVDYVPLLNRGLEAQSGHTTEVLITPGRSLTLRDLCELWRLMNEMPVRELGGTSVGLYDCTELQTILAVILLDGLVRRLVLLPPELADEQLSALLDETGPEALVTASSAVPRLPAIDPAELTSSRNAQSSNLDRGEEVVVPDATGHRTEWILTTSGTTGTPRPVSHSLASLTRSVPTGEGRSFNWGLLYSVYRFAGLQVFLHSFLGNGRLLVPEGIDGLKDQLLFFKQNGCNAISATPTLWRKILMTSAGKKLELRQITLGGEIADRAILSALAHTYPDAHLTHIYASTEAGVGFAVHDGEEGFPANFLDDPPGDTEIAVDEDGHLLLRPPSEAVPSAKGRRVGKKGWIDTGDLVERKGDRFVFRGREDGALNVGGNLVYPEEVEQFMLQLSEVAAAAVSGRRSSIAGNVLVARVVPEESSRDLQSLEDSILEKCRSELPRYKQPAQIEFVERLDTTPAGKLARET